MSINQYKQAVINVFETNYPQFWWDDYFLDEEKPRIEKHLRDELAAGCPPMIALNNLLRTMGRM